MQKHGLGRLPAWWQGGLILCALLWMAAPGGAAERSLKQPGEAMIHVGDASATVTTVTLAGTVVDAAGRPVAGAAVLLACMTRSHVGLPQQVTEWTMALGPRAAYFSTRTDARGAFAFTLFRGEGLPYDGTPDWFRKPGRPGWGEYYVVVAPQGEDGGAIAGPLINDVVPEKSGRNCQLPPLRPEELKAGLRLVLQPARTLLGRVTTLAGEALTGTTISATLFPPDRGHCGQALALLRQTTRCDAQGRYELHNLYPGVYQLNLGQEQPPYWTHTRASGETTWTLQRHDEVDLSTATQALEWMIGVEREPNYPLEGRVTDSTGRPIAGATITGRPALRGADDWDELGWKDEQTTSDATGAYRLRMPMPWLRHVRVEKAGYPQLRRERQVLAGASRMDFELEVPAQHRLQGTVTRADGKPAVGVEVLLLRMGRRGNVTAEQARTLGHYHSRTNDMGHYEFAMGDYHNPGEMETAEDALPPYGNYYVMVMPGDGHAGAISPKLQYGKYMGKGKGYVGPDLRRLDPEFAPLELRLEPGVRVMGQVVTAQGKPADAVVEFFVDQYPGMAGQPGERLLRRQTRTNAQGRFEFEGVTRSNCFLTLVRSKMQLVKTRRDARADWHETRADWIELTSATQNIALEIMLMDGTDAEHRH